MPTADERPPHRAKSRTWLWGSLAAIVFFGAGFATIAWANDRSHNPAPPVAVVTTTTGNNSPTGTTNSAKSTPSKSTAPGTTVPAIGELGAVAVVGDSLSV